MILLQVDLPTEASQSFIDQWGAPGAVIVFLIFGIVLASRWLARREDRRIEYEKIQKNKDSERFDKLQEKYDNSIVLQAQNTEKVIGIAADLKDVVVNNTIAVKEFSSYLKNGNK